MFASTVRALCAASFVFLTAAGAEACTRILWNDNDYAVMVGRTMDWPESTQPILTLLPRGMDRNGGMAGPETVVADNPAKWTSTYGSIVTTTYGIGAADGMNEKGLAMHMLYLNATDFGPRDASKPGLQAGLWGQFVLDNAATVNEALKLLETVQIVPVSANGHDANVHLALEDATGDSAIIEHIDGKAIIHHGREYVVMTNDPSYDQQLEILKTQDFSHPSSTMPLPGNVNPIDRFARATYYRNLLPKPANEREAAASILSVARNVSVPFGAPYKDFGIYNTEYRTAANLSDLRYYFELTTSPNLIWVDLGSVNLDAGQPVRVLNPDSISFNGNVTGDFSVAPTPY